MSVNDHLNKRVAPHILGNTKMKKMPTDNLNLALHTTYT